MVDGRCFGQCCLEVVTGILIARVFFLFLSVLINGGFPILCCTVEKRVHVPFSQLVTADWQNIILNNGWLMFYVVLHVRLAMLIGRMECLIMIG